MSNLNVVVIDGNLTKAAELSYWNDGTPYCQFSIANNESYKKEDGTYANVASFFDCMLKGNYAQSMSKYLLKGRKVQVTGRLKQSRWEKDGQTHSRVFIKVEQLYLSPVSNGNEQGQTNYSGQQQSGYNNYNNGQNYNQKPEYNPDEYQSSPIDCDFESVPFDNGGIPF